MKRNEEMVTINSHKIHIYRLGENRNPKLVFMAGSGTVSPVHDFKVLYEKLMKNFRIIVIEKFGYGYSDIFDAPCDIDTLVSIQKQALESLEETGPYILLPHSMSGLEAIRWKQKYPQEVSAIVGIDMATPFTYETWTNKKISGMIKMTKMAKTLKFHKIPKLYPLNNRCLSKEEIREQESLKKRNAFNICYINEGKEVLNNSNTVKHGGNIECPMLLFSSNGKQIDQNWVKNQQKFASLMDAKLICFDCGHYIHYYRSDEMSREIITFVSKLHPQTGDAQKATQK